MKVAARMAMAIKRMFRCAVIVKMCKITIIKNCFEIFLSCFIEGISSRKFLVCRALVVLCESRKEEKSG